MTDPCACPLPRVDGLQVKDVDPVGSALHRHPSLGSASTPLASVWADVEGTMHVSELDDAVAFPRATTGKAVLDSHPVRQDGDGALGAMCLVKDVVPNIGR
jgi:hypothetical protein